MLDELTRAVEQAVRRRDPAAGAFDVLSTEHFPESDSGEVVGVDLAWMVETEQRSGRFVAKPKVDDEARLLVSLAGTRVSTPILFEPTAEPDAPLVMERLPGRPLGELLREAGMRWELSALSFSFARALAAIHALDWRQVVPWLADAESLAEDLVDDQIEARWAEWEARIASLPAAAQTPFTQALRWLDLRRPVDVSVCLCHGDFNPWNVLVASDEVSGVVDWESALATDASYDLALLPFEIARLGLPDEDAELIVQAALGAYLQASPRTLENVPFFTVARLLDGALSATTAAETIAHGESLSRRAQLQAARRDEWLDALTHAMRGDAGVPWRR